MNEINVKITRKELLYLKNMQKRLENILRRIENASDQNIVGPIDGKFYQTMPGESCDTCICDTEPTLCDKICEKVFRCLYQPIVWQEYDIESETEEGC